MVEATAEEDSGPNAALKEAGASFGKYTLLCRIATGGMGEIFVARQDGAGGFEKRVVIKRLLPHLAEAGQGYLICEGDHTRPGSFVWLDLDGRKVMKSALVGVFPDGLVRVPGTVTAP